MVRREERFYWWLTLSFGCVGVVLVAAADFSAFSLRGLHLESYHFLVPFFGGLVVTVGLETWISRKNGVPSRFWIRHPSLTCRHQFAGPPDELVKSLGQRLRAQGFELAASVAPGRIEFAKASKQAIHGFLDHAFSGWVTLQATSTGTEVEMGLTMRDIVLVETGEYAKLRALGDTLCGIAAEARYEIVPLILRCGIVLAGLVPLLLWMSCARNGMTPWFVGASAEAAGLILVSVVVLMANRRHLIGWRLIAPGLVLAAIPWIGIMLRAA